MATSNYYCYFLVPIRSAAFLRTTGYKLYVCPGATRHRWHGSVAAARVGEQRDQKLVVRRSANYGDPIYNFESVQSLNNGYSEEKYARRANELKEQVKLMLGKDMPLLECLEIVDDIERLGLASHFEHQVYNILSGLYNRTRSQFVKPINHDLYAVALQFRMLRKHGFQVSPGNFI